MLYLSSEDRASVGVVVAALEAQIAELGQAPAGLEVRTHVGAESRIVHLWRDWAEQLRPAAAGVGDHSLDLALELTTPGGIGT